RACSSTADQARSRAAASAGVAGRGQYSPFVVESSLMGSAGAGSRSDFRMVTSTSHELTLFGRTRTPRPGGLTPGGEGETAQQHTGDVGRLEKRECNA